MSTNAVCLKLDQEGMDSAIQKVREQLNDDEVVLDFSAVRRIDTGGLRALEDLAAVAREKGTTIVLRGVNIDVYKVLKLAKLASRLSFVN